MRRLRSSIMTGISGRQSLTREEKFVALVHLYAELRLPFDAALDAAEAGHSNRRPLADQEIHSGPRYSAPRQARPTSGVSGRRRSGPAGSLSNIFEENRLQSSGSRNGQRGH